MKGSIKVANKNDTQDIVFENQKIIDIRMEKEVKRSFIEYSMSVIMSRALPDARDGMKPGQRRILYAMYEDRLTNDRPFRKSATTVGNVLGRYHPHGDSAVYGTMVRMAQPFSYRYPLIEGHGNFGSVDGDGAAAYRYTEARLEKIANEIMRDIEKEVVPFAPNFDNRLREPTVLPARFPNLLVNGAVGIAVGMATNIPPHNLGEVIDAAFYRMDNPDCTVAELMEFIKGPDFPTAATIYGVNGIIQAYTTGYGRISVRARAIVEEDKRRIIVTEIPYMVNKSMLCKAIANLVKDKRIEGITELRDESGRDGMRIVIEHRRDVNGQIILNQLYKYTQMQDTCAVNMLAIVGKEPKVLPLADILDIYIAHQESVIINRTEFDLRKARAKAHIYEGFHIALDNIDRVIEIMKGSKTISEAKETLMEEFFTVRWSQEYARRLGIENGLTQRLSEIQAQAIVDMTLGKLTGMERQKIEDELLRLHTLVAELEGILADINKVRQIIKDELGEIRRRYADERKTEILPVEDEIILEDLIERHSCIITLTHAGYIKRQHSDTYSAQRRGGRGIIGASTKEEDFIEKVLAVNSHSNLLMFTNTGKVFMRRAYQIPEASRTAKGTNLVNILELEPGEKVTTIISVENFAGDEYLTMVTKFGVIKRTLLTEYEYQRRGGKIALTLDAGDELVFVMRTDGRRDLIIATAQGYAVRFKETKARTIGRVTRGVRGISLRGDDSVRGVALVEKGKHLISITEKGFGKLTAYSDFRPMKNRGGYGVICHNINKKTGQLAGISSVSESDDIMLITDTGTIIRMPVSDIPVYSRSAAGVIVMRMAEEQSIVNFTRVVSEKEEEDALSEAEQIAKAEKAEKGNNKDEKIKSALHKEDIEEEEDLWAEKDTDEEDDI